MVEMQVKRVKVRELAELLLIHDGYFAVLEFQKTVMSEFLQHPVDVDGAHSNRLAEKHLTHRETKGCPGRRFEGFPSNINFENQIG